MGLLLGELTAGGWFVLARHELFLFAACFFLIGALDEMAVDLGYLWLRLTGRARTGRVVESDLTGAALAGRCAVFIPAWQEQRVIAATIAHALAAWPQRELRLYVGCYRNDPATLGAAMTACEGDPRVRLVIHDAVGPTCKADCLNRLYRALCDDETREGNSARMVVLHDAEDMVDPAALPLLDLALAHVDFAQLPVLALPRARSSWIAGHYSDEFAEAHARTMVVRSALGAGIPGAGVGCAIGRDWLERLDAAIRQKARWIHGIALQGWDRLGWRGAPAAVWMQLRDRRGPLAALLLAIAYVLVIAAALERGLELTGLVGPAPLPRELVWLLWANLAALGWRAAARALFTAREFGPLQGALAVPRIVVSNTIAIVAGRRALAAYARTLRGQAAVWDKTEHTEHPVLARPLGPGAPA